MRIMVNRSAEWLKGEMVALGCNLDEDIGVETDPTNLPIETRQVIVGMHGQYPKVLDNLSYDSEYQPNPRSNYGNIPFRIDKHPSTITSLDIAAAIGKAFDELAATRTEEMTAREERQAKRDRIEQERIDEVHKRAIAMATAREFLAKELAELSELKMHHQLLSEFVGRLPAPALNQALDQLLEDGAEDGDGESPSPRDRLRLRIREACAEDLEF